jgi:hypothetical protein
MLLRSKTVQLLLILIQNKPMLIHNIRELVYRLRLTSEKLEIDLSILLILLTMYLARLLLEIIIMRFILPRSDFAGAQV